MTAAVLVVAAIAVFAAAAVWAGGAPARDVGFTEDGARISVDEVVDDAAGPASDGPPAPTTRPAGPTATVPARDVDACEAGLSELRTTMETPVGDPRIAQRWEDITSSLEALYPACGRETMAAFERDEFFPWAQIGGGRDDGIGSAAP